MLQLCWADEATLETNNRGLIYGDGLFETLRVEGASAPLLSYHLERLVRDAGRLGIPVARHDIARHCDSALARYCGLYGDTAWILKLILTRGEGGRGYRPAPDMRPTLILQHAPAPQAPPAAGVYVDFSRVPLTVNPVLSGIKTLNRLEQVMAARELVDPVFEVLMSNAAGDVVEGTRTNLFVRLPEGWVTPPASSLAVSGVMRQRVIERLHSAGEALTERPLGLGELVGHRCQAICLTNSVLGVVPVRSLAGQDLPVDSTLATICLPSN